MRQRISARDREFNARVQAAHQFVKEHLKPALDAARKEQSTYCDPADALLKAIVAFAFREASDPDNSGNAQELFAIAHANSGIYTEDNDLSYWIDEARLKRLHQFNLDVIAEQEENRARYAAD